MVETEDKRVGPAMLDEATRGPGSDGATVSGGRGAKCDSVAVSLLPTVQSAGSALSIVVSPPPRKTGWISGRRKRAEERSSCMQDSSRRPMARVDHWSLVLLRRDGWCCSNKS